VSKLSKKKTKKKNLNEIFKKAEIFFQNIGHEDRLALIHDSDPDGVCSATVAIEALKRLGISSVGIFARGPESVKKSGILENGFNKILVLDLAPHLYQKDLERIKRMKKDVLIFDHHLTAKLGAKNIFYVNPRLAEKSLYLPTSYLIFKYFESRTDISDMEWIAAIGTVADYGINPDTKDLIGKYVEMNRERIWETEYGRAASILNASTAIIGPEKTLKILQHLKSFEQFKRVKAFTDSMRKFDTELKNRENEVRGKIEFYPEKKLMISYVRTKYKHIASVISSRISREKKNWTFILFEKRGDEYKLHGRSQAGRVSIGLLFSNLGVGGGHVQAGGGSIKVKNLEKFEKALIREIGLIDRKKR